MLSLIAPKALRGGKSAVPCPGDGRGDVKPDFSQMNAAFERPTMDRPLSSGAPLLEMRGISQIFPGVKALDQVSIALYPGE